MEKISYKLDVFEGPMDLLLHLISKNKVSIYDIPISLILEQYMEYIEDLKKMDLEVSSAFIEMAAQLMLIKSRMLLPKPELDEEDPRMSLAEALAEYKRYKTILEPMREMNKKAGITYTRPMTVMEFDKKHIHQRIQDLPDIPLPLTFHIDKKHYYLYSTLGLLLLRL